MNLSKELAERARKKGICKEWHDELLSLKDKDKMIKMYLRGIDFCLSNDYPENDFIRSYFKGAMEKYGVFLDDAVGQNGELGRCFSLHLSPPPLQSGDWRWPG